MGTEGTDWVGSRPERLSAGNGEVRDGLGVKRFVDRHSSFECSGELLASPCGQRVEVRGDCRCGERRAKLSRAVEAQGQDILRDTDVVEAGLLQQLPQLVALRHTPWSVAVAIGDLVAGYFLTTSSSAANAGDCSISAQTAIPTRPAGRSARRISASAAARSGKNCSPC